MGKKNFKLDFRHFLLYFAVSLVGIIFICYSILFTLENQKRSVRLEDLKNHEMTSVSLGGSLLGREFYSVIADLNYLVKVYKDFLAGNICNNTLALNWVEFSEQQEIYDRISFVQADGQEKVRVNYEYGTASVAFEGDLVNKSDLIYFSEPMSLPEGSVYVSSLELRIKDGEVEAPYRPIMRFSEPVFSDNGDILGVIILNYLAEETLGNFRDIAIHSEGQMMLLNEDGYWLSSPDGEHDWNFMFTDSEVQNFGKYFPKEWDKIYGSSGQIMTEKGLFTYTYVLLDDKMKYKITEGAQQENVVLGGGNWYIVTYVPREGEMEDYFTDNIFVLLKDVFIDDAWLFALLAMVSVVIGFLVYLYMKTYMRTKYYSQYDSLTSVYNRRTGTDKLDEVLIAQDRKDFKISVCFIDINGLKEVNDNLGHKMGDELLLTVADILKSQIRESDFIVRMGGDEFLLVLSRIEPDAAEIVWMRIHTEIERINQEEDRPYIISVSHGVVGCGGENACMTTDGMIKRADELMYEEKRRLKIGFYAVRSKEKL